eukprot:GCRY01002813.1.p1 GENE.GCRY01002813.1~~GCRY01002813.1.p1  ORF type:complete len:426 (+),score=87.64 GCRY01002813.1:131-1408(+)
MNLNILRSAGSFGRAAAAEINTGSRLFSNLSRQGLRTTGAKAPTYFKNSTNQQSTVLTNQAPYEYNAQIPLVINPAPFPSMLTKPVSFGLTQDLPLELLKLSNNGALFTLTDYQKAQGMFQSSPRVKLREKHPKAVTVEELYSSLVQQTSMKKPVNLQHLHKILVKCNTPEDMEHAFRAVRLFRFLCIPTTDETCSLFVKASCRCKVPEKGLAAMATPALYGLSPSRKSYHFMMVRLSVEKNLNAVFTAFNLMEKIGMEITNQTFHVVIRACCDNDFVDGAEHFLSLCERAGHSVERGTYNVVMNAMMKANRASRLLKLFGHMLARGVAPNEGSFLLCTRAHLHLGDIDQALRTFEDLIQAKEDQLFSLGQAELGNGNAHTTISHLPADLLSSLAQLIEQTKSENLITRFSNLLQRHAHFLPHSF